LVPVLDVFENVELPLLLHAELTPAARRERVEQALGDVALLDFRRHWPDKLSVWTTAAGGGGAGAGDAAAAGAGG
jgi:ABC-type nitrate/sulfonate/bicarbonate transport system ATPase subunit